MLGFYSSGRPGWTTRDDVTDLLDHAAHRRVIDDLDRVADAPQTQPAHDLALLLVVADDAAHLLDAERLRPCRSSPWCVLLVSDRSKPALAGADELLELLAAERATRWRLLERPQAGEGRAHHVVRVVRAEALGQDVLDAGRLDDGADRAAGDDAGAVRGRLEQHAAGAEAAEMACGSVVPASGTRTSAFFADSMPFLIAEGTSLALPMPKPTWPWPSPTMTRALKLRFLPPLTTLVTRLMDTTVSFRSSSAASIFWLKSNMSELQPRFAGRVGDRLDPAVVQEAAAVEDHARDALGLQSLGDDAPMALAPARLPPLAPSVSLAFSAGSVVDAETSVVPA